MTNTPPPATTWVGGMQQEYTAGSPNDIADSAGNELVDGSGVFIVDNGVVETDFPTTTWSVNDSEY